MTEVKVQSRDNLESPKSLAEKQLKSSGDKSISRFTLYTQLTIIGILVAVLSALLLYLPGGQGHGKVVPSTPETSKQTGILDMEGRAPPVCFNADGYEWDYGCVLAIDVGESYSRIGASINSSLQVFRVDGQQQMSNYVAYTDHGVLVGQEARDQAEDNPKNTIFDVRRILGRRFSSDSSLQRDIDSLPYDVVRQDDKPVIKVLVNGQEKFIALEEVHAEVLEKLKAAATDYYGSEVNATVMTVPAYFNDDQRQAIKDAGAIAGLNVLRLVNEPTAAAIAHGIDRRECTRRDCEEFIVVYNLEEKHNDITVSSVEMGVYEILDTKNDRLFGGRNLDDSLLDYVVGEFQKSGKVHLMPNSDAFAGLKRRVLEAEIALKTQASATIDSGGVSLIVTQIQLQNIHKSAFGQSIQQIVTALKNAKLSKTDISHLIIAGNTTQVAKIQPILEALFDGLEAHSSVPSDQTILRGAAHQADIFSGDSGTDWVGAFDISVLSLGLETNGGLFKKIIPRNTPMPKRSAVNVTTINDNQPKIVLNIFEGERGFVADNRLFGSFNVTDLSPRPAGKVVIEVVFDLDPNGILTVSARDLESGKKTVFDSSDTEKLNYNDVDKIISDAESYAEEDNERLAAMSDGALGEYTDEFGIVVVEREGDIPR